MVQGLSHLARERFLQASISFEDATLVSARLCIILGPGIAIAVAVTCLCKVVKPAVQASNHPRRSLGAPVVFMWFGHPVVRSRA